MARLKLVAQSEVKQSSVFVTPPELGAILLLFRSQNAPSPCGDQWLDWSAMQ